MSFGRVWQWRMRGKLAGGPSEVRVAELHAQQRLVHVALRAGRQSVVRRYRRCPSLSQCIVRSLRSVALQGASGGGAGLDGGRRQAAEVLRVLIILYGGRATELGSALDRWREWRDGGAPSMATNKYNAGSRDACVPPTQCRRRRQRAFRCARRSSSRCSNTRYRRVSSKTTLCSLRGRGAAACVSAPRRVDADASRMSSS